jgi:phage-related holin
MRARFLALFLLMASVAFADMTTISGWTIQTDRGVYSILQRGEMYVNLTSPATISNFNMDYVSKTAPKGFKVIEVYELKNVSKSRVDADTVITCVPSERCIGGKDDYLTCDCESLYNNTDCVCTSKVTEKTINYSEMEWVLFNGTKYNIVDKEVKQYKIVFTVPIGSSGKFDVSFSVDGSKYTLDPWWDSDWDYRRSVVLNSTAASTLTNYPAYFVIDTDALITANKMQSACQDLRVANETDELYYYIEEGTCDTTATVVYVKIAYFLTGNNTVYAYYGNAGASDAQSAANTFSNSFTSVYLTANGTDALGANLLLNQTLNVSPIAGFDGGSASNVTLQYGLRENQTTLFNPQTTNVTISGWVKPWNPLDWTTGVENCILCGEKSSSTTPIFALMYVNSTGRMALGAQIRNDANSIVTWYGGSNISLNAWNYFAYRWNQVTGQLQTWNGSAWNQYTMPTGANSVNRWSLYTEHIGTGYQKQARSAMDRIYVASVNRTADWLLAEYAQVYWVNTTEEEQPAGYKPFFNVTWNYPGDNVWNTTTQNIKHYFTPLWYDNTIGSVGLWTNKTGTFTLAVANSSAVTNDTMGYLQYDYGADSKLIYAYFNITNSTGTSNFTANFTIKIDTADPVTSADATPYTFGTWSLSSPVTVTLSCEDVTSGCLITKYCTDAVDSCTPNTEYTVPVEISDEGTTYIRFNSTDNTGNIEIVSSEEVDIDTVAPVTTPSAGSYSFGDWSITAITVTLSCDDDTSGCASTKYCTDAVDTCTPSTSYSVPFEISTEGTSYVRFNSTDAAGNAETINSETVRIDTADPDTTASPVDEWSNTYTFTTWTKSSYIDVSLSCADTTSGCLITKYCTDEANTCTPATTYSTAVHMTTEGTSYIRYNSTDNAGNTETIHSGAVMIDTADPSTDATGEKDDETSYTFNVWAKTSYVDVTMTCSDDTSGCAVTKYCADTVNICTPVTTVLAPARISTDGTSYIRYNSTDNAGNIKTIQSQILKIDDVAPVTTATAIENDSSPYTFGAWTTSLQVNVTLACADTGGSGCFVTYYCNDTGNTCTPDTEWTEAVQIEYLGISYFRYNSTDAVGNIGTIQSKAIYIDPDYVAAGVTYGLIATSFETKIAGELGNTFGEGAYCLYGEGETCAGGMRLEMGAIIMAVFILAFFFIWSSVSGIAWDGVFLLMFMVLVLLSDPMSGFIGASGWALASFLFAVIGMYLVFRTILRRG